MRLLVATSKLPYPATGADEQDRFEGIRLFTELGHTVSVLAKISQYQKQESVDAMSKAIGAEVRTVPYATDTWSLKKMLDPRWLDGAAFEYAKPETIRAFESQIASFAPDRIWLDGSYSWPLIAVAHKHGIPVSIRSLQIESTHVLVDEGVTAPNLIRAFGKHLGEMTLAKTADCVVALNRNEERLYRQMGAKNTVTVPLRNLPSVLEDEPVSYRNTNTIKVLFSGSTFSVKHNKDGAVRVFTKVAPLLEKAAPGVFTIHVTGAKLPPDIAAALPPNVVYEGYVADYAAFVKSMDVALTQSLGTVGMHGKLFEPIARGIPTIGMPYALAGFPFEDHESILFAEKVDDVVRALLELRDVRLRESIGRAGRTKAEEFFSRKALHALIGSALSMP